MGVVSDYPAEEKLRCLGLRARTVVCTTDPQIVALKPHPKGLLKASELLGIPPARALVIGDLYDLDGLAAQRAGMLFLIKERRASGRPNRFVVYADLLETLEGH